MDVVVSGRHCEVSDEFREHVVDKLGRLEKHDHRIIRVEALVVKQSSRRPEQAIKVELTARSKGPVVRSEALSGDKLAALDLALDKMSAQMRKAADRRKVHRGQHAPASVRTGGLPESIVEPNPSPAEDHGSASQDQTSSENMVGPVSVTGDGPLVVREKSFSSVPMTLEQALYEMELVGHDFYLFCDRASGLPSVVYRRKGYDYGVIALDVQGEGSAAEALSDRS